MGEGFDRPFNAMLRARLLSLVDPSAIRVAAWKTYKAFSQDSGEKLFKDGIVAVVKLFHPAKYRLFTQVVENVSDNISELTVSPQPVPHELRNVRMYHVHHAVQWILRHAVAERHGFQLDVG